MPQRVRPGNKPVQRVIRSIPDFAQFIGDGRDVPVLVIARVEIRIIVLMAERCGFEPDPPHMAEVTGSSPVSPTIPFPFVTNELCILRHLAFPKPIFLVAVLVAVPAGHLHPMGRVMP